MKLHIYKLLPLFIAILLQFTANASSSILYSPQLYKHISTKNGNLSNDEVLCLKHDSRGYLWIGTNDGLNRYNGHTTKIYRNSDTNHILGSNKINCIEEDSNGRLWVGTDNGVSIFDFEKDSFLLLDKQPNASKIITQSTIVAIAKKDKGEMLCVTDKGGILIYNNELSIKKFTQIPNSKLFDIKKLTNSEYIIASRENIRVYDVEIGDERVIFNQNKGIIKSIHKDKSKIYITLNNSIYAANYSIKDGKASIDKFTEYYKLDIRINHSTIDSLGGIWCGINRYGFTYTSTYTNKEEITLLPIRKISNIQNLSNKEMAISTLDNGVYFYSINPYRIGEIKLDKKEGSAIWKVSKLDNERIFIMHESDAPHAIFNTSTNKLENNHRLLNKLELKQRFYSGNDNFMKGLIDYNNNRITLKRFEGENFKTIEQESGDDTQFDKFKIGFCVEDYLKKVWIPSTDGLYRLHPKYINTDSAYFSVERLSLPNPSNKEIIINNIEFDSINNRAWLSTSNHGIYRIDNCNIKTISSTDIYHYNSSNKESNLPTESIWATAICDSVIWVATEYKGVCKGVIRGKKVIFSVIEEEPQSSARSIIKDKYGNLWIGKDRGLAYFNTKSLKSKIFTQADGIPFNSFSSGALKINDSLFVMQSESKIVVLNANLLKRQETLPKISFENLTVLNKKVTPSKKYNDNIVITSTLSAGDTIFLTHNTNSFSLDLFSLNSSISKKGYIKYRLLPNDNKWQILNNKNNSISFTNLAYGDYTLEVSACNDDGIFCKKEQIFITVSTPFWFTKYAFLIYLTSFIIIIYFAYKLRYKNKIKTIKEEAENEKSEIKHSKYTQDDNNEINQFMNDFYKLVEENFDNEELDLNLIAKKLLLNRTHFFQKIKQITNKTPYELIKEYRLEKAAEMLQNGEKSIDTVCVQTGFKGRSHFSRLFKEKYGVPPSQYLKNINQHKQS